MSDQLLEARVREELYHGNVLMAYSFANQIRDNVLKQEMIAIIKEYELT